MTKSEKFEIIQKTNSAYDSYHTHIRSVEEVRDWNEILDPADFDDNRDKFTGSEKTLTVYSSKKIKPGTFVSTSLQQAGEYASAYIYEAIHGEGWEVGNYQKSKIFKEIGKEAAKFVGVNYKTIDVDEVAWINRNEGIYVGK